MLTTFIRFSKERDIKCTANLQCLGKILQEPAEHSGTIVTGAKGAHYGFVSKEKEAEQSGSRAEPEDLAALRK